MAHVYCQPGAPAHWPLLPEEMLRSLWGSLAGWSGSWTLLFPTPQLLSDVPSGVSLSGLLSSAWSILLAAWAGGGVAWAGVRAGMQIGGYILLSLVVALGHPCLEPAQGPGRASWQ